MKKMLVYGFFIITISSCKKEFSTHVESSAIKDKTIAWMISKKTNASPIEAATIDSVMNNLNWDLIFTDQINDSLTTAFIPINSNADKRLTILYNTKQKTVNSGNLVSITTLYNRSYRNNINIYKVNFNENFTGTISIFSIKNEFENKMGIANGKKIFTAEKGTKMNGESVENKNPNKKSYAENCIYHYLVVTTYYGNLTSGKEWIYQGKTCTSNSRDCEITSINQIANESFIHISTCEGSGSGGGGLGNAEELYDPELKAFEKYYLPKMSELEKKIYYNELNFIQRILYLKNAQLASKLAESNFLNTTYNGKGDAFRHAFFIAMNARDLGLDLAKRLADAHELKNNPKEILSSEMDRRNNLVGLEIYNILNNSTDYIYFYSMLYGVINQYLDNGYFWILSNLAPNGEETNLSRLIKSNEKQ
jgi:hypothetical protein